MRGVAAATATARLLRATTRYQLGGSSSPRRYRQQCSPAASSARGGATVNGGEGSISADNDVGDDEVPTDSRCRRMGEGEGGGGGGEGEIGGEADETMGRRRVKGKHLDRPWYLTYLRKQGKVTQAQKSAIRHLWQRYGCEVTTYSGKAGVPPPKLDVRGEVFKHRPDAPLVLEIGFGLGDSLLEMAANHPEKNFIGVEVHKPGIGAALIKLEDARLTAAAAAAAEEEEEKEEEAEAEADEPEPGAEEPGVEEKKERGRWVDNVRLIRMDALWLLRDFIPPRSLSDVCVYFPDPWSDAQSHRRIVNPFLLKLIEPCMDHGSSWSTGYTTKPRLHLSTDDAAYAAHMLRIMSAAEDTGKWTKEEASESSTPGTCTGVMLGRSRSTKYEERGRAQGSSIHNFCYRFVGGGEEEG